MAIGSAATSCTWSSPTTGPPKVDAALTGAAALAVVLFLFVTPLIVFNVIQIRKQREIR